MTEEQKRRHEQFRQERETWRTKYGEIALLDFPQFYRGYFAVEYEEQGDGVLGSKQIKEEVLAAL